MGSIQCGTFCVTYSPTPRSTRHLSWWFAQKQAADAQTFCEALHPKAELEAFQKKQAAERAQFAAEQSNLYNATRGQYKGAWRDRMAGHSRDRLNLIREQYTKDTDFLAAEYKKILVERRAPFVEEAKNIIVARQKEEASINKTQDDFQTTLQHMSRRKAGYIRLV